MFLCVRRSGGIAARQIQRFAPSVVPKCSFLRAEDLQCPNHVNIVPVELHIKGFIEFWAVATRPLEANGFGWTSHRTAKEVTDLQDRFVMLADSPEVLTCWLELVK